MPDPGEPPPDDGSESDPSEETALEDHLRAEINAALQGWRYGPALPRHEPGEP
jgi:hypothetical protein